MLKCAIIKRYIAKIKQKNMEFLKKSFETIKNKINSQEKKSKTWESKIGNLSKEYLSNLENDFTQLNAEVLKTKIKFLGKTESGESILTSGFSRKELVSPKEIGETEGGGVIYEHSPLYNFIKEAVELTKNWQEKITSEKLTDEEKKILNNTLKIKIQSLKNSLFDIRHQADPDKAKKDVLKKAKLYFHEEGLKTNELSNIDECIAKIQNLAETYSPEESSDDSIRQAVILIGRISTEEKTEPKKLIFDLKSIFSNPDKKDIETFYEKLLGFFDTVENIQKNQTSSILKDDETQIMGPPPAFNA